MVTLIEDASYDVMRDGLEANGYGAKPKLIGWGKDIPVGLVTGIDLGPEGLPLSCKIPKRVINMMSGQKEFERGLGRAKAGNSDIGFIVTPEFERYESGHAVDKSQGPWGYKVELQHYKGGAKPNLLKESFRVDLSLLTGEAIEAGAETMFLILQMYIARLRKKIGHISKPMNMFDITRGDEWKEYFDSLSDYFLKCGAIPNVNPRLATM